MKRDNSPWQPVTPATLDWGESGPQQSSCPSSRHFGDVYYSRDDGIEESRYVFLQGNRLTQRLSEHPHDTFCIGETGFGTGLNFLLTWQLWRSLPEPMPRLHYLSMEKHPLGKEDLQRALSSWPELRSLAESLLNLYPPLIPGNHRLLLDGGQLVLDLWWEDAAEALTDLASRDENRVDAWYLDGFAPALNESMWQPTLMESMARLSRPSASFATFTAAGQVRRDLSTAGFAVRKVPGFGRKRECLQGELNLQPKPPTAQHTPWDLQASPQITPGNVLIVGAGLAGCTTAAALARRGIAVTLLDRGSLAGEGSGNEQGILYTRLSRRHSPLADFALSSFCFASRYYGQMLASGKLASQVDGELCGSFHQSGNDQDMHYLHTALEGIPELGQVVDAQRASEILGVEQPTGGYWFPTSGWLRPVSVCRALATSDGVELIENCGDIQLEREGKDWLAIAGGKTLARAPCAVVASGYGARAFTGMDWLPLQAIRGQTTQLPAAVDWSGLQAALCHEGYIAPARNGQHCIGATFNLNDDDRGLRASDHQRNLTSLARAVPTWRESLERVEPTQLTGRVGYRCASPDYLPLVGPAPDRTAFLQDFTLLRKNARQTLPVKGPYMPGLYLNTAHGSRGLSSTPLAAEWLASSICNEPPPVGRELARALSPARFIIRDLRRKKI